MKKNEKEGFIYVASNIAMPSYLKFGYTYEDDVKKRIRQLSNSSVPFDFDLECHVRVCDAPKAEATIHQLLKSYRVNDSREFFVVDINLVKNLFKTIENDPELNKGKNISKPNSEKLLTGKIINIKHPEHKAEFISKNKILYNGLFYRLHQFINFLIRQKQSLDDWQIGNRKLSDIADDLIYS